MANITYTRGHAGTYEIWLVDEHNVIDESVESVLSQLDYDRCGLANTFGWSPCHNCTDGTIDCAECDKTATELISDATDYLNEHYGDIAEDPGYFNQ